MERYDDQLNKLSTDGVEVDECSLMGSKLPGLYIEDKDQPPVVMINPSLSPREKSCILAEEAGHHYRTCGKIIRLSDAWKRKQERTARAWGFEYRAPLEEIAQAWLNGANTIWDLADELGITEKFLVAALDYYRERYGILAELPDDVYVQLDPYFDVYKDE